MTSAAVTDPVFPSPGHDHGACVREALDAAESRCLRSGVRLTALRRRVLELVWAGHGPVGAYALLESLRGDGQAAGPPTVYRALEFLQGQGLIHRIERLNAFVGCPRPDDCHAAQFLICDGCGVVAEMDDAAVTSAVVQGAARLGFSVSRQSVEVAGLCPACHPTPCARPDARRDQ